MLADGVGERNAGRSPVALVRCPSANTNTEDVQ